MKKVVFTLLFATGLFAMNANNSGPMIDCHAVACQVVAQYEAFAPDADDEEVEGVYQDAYDNCQGN